MSRKDSNCPGSSDAKSHPLDAVALSPGDFTAFFRDIHGHDPFPWQQRLAGQVLVQKAWPKVIDLPTGTGKTAVLDIAVFAMAAQSEIFPRRIVFVIDRRIVVDQVYKRAEQIRNKIEGGKTRILQRVKDRLRALSGGEPLGVATLRGGIPIENEWAHRPDQPWVIVSTVDQFGSRLLFRGYGTSRGMRPIHAGLAGNDCLVILDEVHLSIPFAKTLAHVSQLESGRLPRRFAVVEMSATPSDTGAKPFVLDSTTDLKECEELRLRVEAAKEAELVPVPNQDAIPAAALKIVKSIAGDKDDRGVRSVGIVVNLVRTARETHRALEGAGYAVSLITGRMRPLDRVATLDRISPAVDPNRDHRTGELTIVVATQSIEVGADFSFDALVTECAAVDSLRQRFGRLDRRGRHFAQTRSAARAWIIGPKSVVASQRPDPIYGDSARTTWRELKRRAKNGSVDVGSRALQGFPSGSTAPAKIAPLLQKTHMDAWAQTNPEPIVQPSVEWFLHGMEKRHIPDVSIVWRSDRSDEALRLVPPRQAEFLPVPINAARSWLSGGDETDVADVDQEVGTKDKRPPLQNKTVASCVRWEGFDKTAEGVTMNKIRPGDVLVVDSSRGGLRSGTWDPSSAEPVMDLGDAAQIAYGRRATLRLDPLLLHMFGTSRPPTPADEAEADLPTREHIEQWLKQGLGGQGEYGDWISKIVNRLGNGFEIALVGIRDGAPGRGYYVLSESHPKTKKPVVDAAVMDGSDRTGSLIGTGVTLSRHLNGVGERAGCIASRLNLATEFVEDLRLAGRLHDIGKVDMRFQAQLAGGDPIYLEMLEEPLAKSLRGVRRFRLYPAGMRHEVASVAMLESNPDVLREANDRDLVLHLVATHHGWGRPLLPIVEDPEPQALSYTLNGYRLESSSDLVESSLALHMAGRFWLLVERYGYYGLAWLEGILRLADHQQSSEEAAP